MSNNLLPSRQWKRCTIQACVGIASIGLIVYALVTSHSDSTLSFESTASAQDGGQGETFDESTYYAIQRLRNEIGLTQRDLAAAGCNAVAAQDVLLGLVDWYQANKVSLYTARNNVLAARKDLYEAGRSDEGISKQNRKVLARAVSNARQSLAEVHASAASRAEQGLMTAQRAHLAAARKNKQIAGNLRYIPGLTSDQRKLIRNGQSSRFTTEQVVEQARLNSTQRQILSEIRSNAKSNTAKVAVGQSLALPIPPAIQAERALESGITADELPSDSSE